MCNISNNYDWFTWFDWMEGYPVLSNFIALMLILNMAMNIRVAVRFLQLKNEEPELSKDQAILRQVKK